MHYRFTYSEGYQVRLEGPTKFTYRQVCVFHRYNPSETGNLWIFLHARPYSELQTRLEREISTAPSGGAPNWFSLHLLVFATYIGNWRWCLRNLGERIEEAVGSRLSLSMTFRGNRYSGRYRPHNGPLQSQGSEQH